MKTIGLSLLVALPLAASAGGILKGDKTRAELKALSGVWEVAESRVGLPASKEVLSLAHGRTIDKVEPLPTDFGRVEIKNGKIGFGTKPTFYAVKLSPSGKVNSIDIQMGKRTYLGVYRLEGGTLLLSLGDTKARPADLDTPAEGQIWLKLQRAKGK
jgi:hypothetical protein